MTIDTLERFAAAQENSYAQALDELRRGEKRSHWMWFVFPQIAGLGHSAMARRYAIRDRAEARTYLADPLLADRLSTCTQAVLDWSGRRSTEAIFGGIDAVKLRSSMTPFEVAGGDAPFGNVIDAFFAGVRDPETLRRLA